MLLNLLPFIVLLAVGIITLNRGKKNLAQASASNDAQEKEALSRLGRRQIRTGRILATVGAIVIIGVLVFLLYLFFILPALQ